MTFASALPPQSPQSPTVPRPSSHPPEPPALLARDLRVVQGRRTVFSCVNAEVPHGGLLVLRGPARSGRTSVLLSLAGRMRGVQGDLHVLGHPVPARAQKVRHTVALAEMPGVNDLDDALTVRQHVAERLLIGQAWWRPWVRGRAVDTAMEAFPFPTPTAQVGDLSPLDRFTLGICLGLVDGPRMLVVDDVDALRAHEDRLAAWTSLARRDASLPSDITVVTSCQESGELTDVLAEAARSSLPVRPVTVVDL
jgi:ABC-type branched-subunit amino acid transport system ATPase component